MISFAFLFKTELVSQNNIPQNILVSLHKRKLINLGIFSCFVCLFVFPVAEYVYSPVFPVGEYHIYSNILHH